MLIVVHGGACWLGVDSPIKDDHDHWFPGAFSREAALVDQSARDAVGIAVWRAAAQAIGLRASPAMSSCFAWACRRV